MVGKTTSHYQLYQLSFQEFLDHTRPERDQTFDKWFIAESLENLFSGVS